jgi:hypothetical protein
VDRFDVTTYLLVGVVAGLAAGFCAGVATGLERGEDQCAERVEVCSAKAGLLLEIVQRCARHEREVLEPCSP